MHALVGAAASPHRPEADAEVESSPGGAHARGSPTAVVALRLGSPPPRQDQSGTHLQKGRAASLPLKVRILSIPHQSDAPDGVLSLAELTPNTDDARRQLTRPPMPSPRPMGELAGGGAASPRRRSKVCGWGLGVCGSVYSAPPPDIYIGPAYRV